MLFVLIINVIKKKNKIYTYILIILQYTLYNIRIQYILIYVLYCNVYLYTYTLLCNNYNNVLLKEILTLYYLH